MGEGMTVIDWRTVSDAELEQARAGVAAEIERRHQRKQLEDVIGPLVRAELGRIQDENQEGGLTRA